ncbi:hypothetical protein F8388_014777 [Cannabis sativa]|uniref:Zinc knuckle CX2CX4HX4C domain-containing protein n=1 Tax=Cannabis sativa TaxID=3483 RepID=A0A7J6GYP0_CANSA|nr:hypothetical protein F8388_014777 [Cannabis sativa]
MDDPGFWAEFKYEYVPTFCFICGVIGHSKRFFSKLFEMPIEEIVKPYGIFMRAQPRRRYNLVGSQWLRDGEESEGAFVGRSNSSSVALGGRSPARPTNVVVGEDRGLGRMARMESPGKVSAPTNKEQTMGIVGKVDFTLNNDTLNMLDELEDGVDSPIMLDTKRRRMVEANVGRTQLDGSNVVDDKAASFNDSVSDCCMTLLTKEDPESISPESEKESKEENLKVSSQKRTFKYIPKSQRGVGQKALTPIEDSITALMISFTLQLRKIDQSLPKGKMQISVSFGKDSKKNKRVITLNKTSPTSVTPKTFKTTKKKVHFKKQKGVTIHQNSDCLKDSFEPDELTEEEQKMFHSDDIPTPSPRVSVFDRLEASTSTPRVSAFERLVFPSAPQSKGTKKQKKVFHIGQLGFGCVILTTLATFLFIGVTPYLGVSCVLFWEILNLAGKESWRFDKILSINQRG